ncbi:MAG: hypothetical protein K2M68_02660 [Muribaculaceae bacterium]|nr:hypothetical protein [Muribaculaceae bacterium]
MGEIHDFLTNNTDVEWTLMEMTDNTTGDYISLMDTTNNSNFDCSAEAILEIALESNYTIDIDCHNHSINIKPTKADIRVLNKISEKFPEAVFKIKIPGDPPISKRYYKDSPTQTQLDEVIVTPEKKN